MNATLRHLIEQPDPKGEADLLAQLRIDRDEWHPANHERRLSRKLTYWCIGVSVVVLAALPWVLYVRFHSATREVAAAKPAPVSAPTPNSDTLLDASGFVVARRKATVSAKATGKLQELYIEVGQRVAQGAIIAKLDDSNARAAVEQSEAGVTHALATLAAARTALEDIGPIYESNRKQADAGLISTQTLLSSKSAYDAQKDAVAVAAGNLAMARGALAVAQRAEEDTVVRAPFTGVIVDKAAQQGEMVSPISAAGGFTRTGIGTLVDMTSLEVEVNVDERFIGQIHLRQPATVKLNAYPDWDIPAFVSAVVPTADRNKGTVAVRIGFQKADPRILPDMAAHVAFLPEQSTAGSASAPRNDPPPPAN